MPTRVASSNLENFRIIGELDELTPLNKNGLVTHVNFEGGLTYQRELNKAKILFIGRRSSHGDLYVNMGCVVTKNVIDNQTDLFTRVLNLEKQEYMQYDLIVIYNHAWALSSDVVNKIDTIIKDGISVFSIANDTATNRYIKSVQNIAITSDNISEITIRDDIPFIHDGSWTYLEAIDSGKSMITGLHPNAIPLNHVRGNKIFTFLVEEKASYIHDNNGEVSTDFLISCTRYLVSRSIGRITNTANLENIPCAEQGFIAMDGTTNIWDGLTSSSRGGSWTVEDNFLPNCPFIYNTNDKVIKATPVNSISWYKVYSQNATEYPGGTKITMSAWMFVEESYNGTNPSIIGESPTPGRADYDLTKKGTWQFITFTTTVGSVGGLNVMLYAKRGGSDSTWTKGNVYYANVQVLKGSHAKEFTTGAYRNTDVTIPVNDIGSDFTVIIDTDIMVDFKNFYPSHSNKNIFSLLDANSTGKKLVYYDYYIHAPESANSPWVAHDEYMSSSDGSYWHWHQGSTAGAFSTGDNVIMVYRKHGANVKFSTFINGIETKTSVTYNIQDLINFRLTAVSLHAPCHKYFKDVFIYSRSLNDDELFKIISPKQLSLNATGNISEKRIIEKPFIDKSVVYFPLSGNNKDYYGFIEPLVAENLTFVENSALVTTGTVNNIFPGIEQVSLQNVTGGIKKVEALGEVAITIMPNDTLSWRTLKLITNRLILDTNSTYELRLEYKYDYPISVFIDLNSTPVEGSSSKNDHMTNISHTELQNNKPNRWHKFRCTFNTPVSPQYFIWDTFGIKNGTVVEVPTELRLRNISYRKISTSAVKYPYTKQGLLPTASLKFNLHESIGLDWSGDWTIVFTKKPLETSNSSVGAGYLLDSIGRNDNSVGGKYLWFGKTYDSNHIRLAGSYNGASVPIDINKFMYDWHIVILRKTGTTIEYHTVPRNAPSTKIQVNATISQANAFVTQNGYDLMLGGWDNGTHCSAQYRDLIIAKRSLTDDELNKITKTFLQAKSRSLKVNNEVIEKALL